MSYRALARTVRPSFLPLGFVARLPGALLPLGTILLLSSTTGSYTFAGVAAGFGSIAMAAAGFASGRLVERFGLRRVGSVAAVLNAVAVAVLVATAELGASRSAVLVAAIATGLTQPQVGALSRVHWSSSPALLGTALAWESAADELSFVIGPVLIGLLAVFQPAAPLIVAALLLLLVSSVYARSYAPVAGKPAGSTAPLPVARLAVLFAAMTCIGAVFGVLQTSMTALAGNRAGLFYAVFGLGSALAALLYARIPARIPLRTRYLAATGALVIAGLLLSMTGSPVPVPVAMLFGGIAVAPYMISVYALTEAAAPRRVATTMTVMGAAVPIGTALGAPAAGALIDAHGARAGFLLLPAITLAALLIAVARRPVAVPPMPSVPEPVLASSRRG